MDTNFTPSIGNDGRELQPHGDRAFPCGFSTYDPSLFDFPWHWHDELEMNYVRRGTLVYGAMGHRHVLREGDAAFANVGVPHAEFSYQGTSAFECNVEFHPDLLCSDHGQAIWTKYLEPLVTSPDIPYRVLRHDGPHWQREAIDCIRQAHEALLLGERHFEVTARERLLRACLLILDNGEGTLEDSSQPASTRTSDRVKRMILFIREHHAEPLDVAAIARVASISPRECQREFDQVIGEGPISYLTECRLQSAAQMLLSTDGPVSAVATACGFSSQSYFTKRFRERYGHTPGEHRRMTR